MRDWLKPRLIKMKTTKVVCEFESEYDARLFAAGLNQARQSWKSEKKPHSDKQSFAVFSCFVESPSEATILEN